ncbi:transposase [Streptomyces sp. NPDC056069]|uniref:helix-turn-helix domain-containing protein n=1 Tax=Streptomyces sp. NPDC056069 TaxID=3345702 RepID=UPI0035D621E6
MRYHRGVRYPQGGGLTAERHQFREELRLKAAERFARGEASSMIAKDLRVSVRSVQRWRQMWDEGLKKFAESRDWLTIYYLPPYAPDLNPVEGIYSLLRGGWLSNVAFSTPEHLVRRIRRGLRHIQYRSHLIEGCLAETGLTIRPPAQPTTSRVQTQ